jgi:hypothetical protein
MRPRANGHKGRYEIFTRVLSLLERSRDDLHKIDLRRCPAELRDDHRAARLAIDEAIRHAKVVCQGELDILNVRSRG